MKAAFEINTEIMFKSAVSYYQTVFKDYCYLRATLDNCFWINHDGYLSYLRGEPQHIAEKLLKKQEELEYAKAQVIVWRQKMKEEGLII